MIQFRESAMPLMIAGIFLIAIWVRGIEFFGDSMIYVSPIQEMQGKTPIYEEKEYVPGAIPMLLNPATIVVSAVIGMVFKSELIGLAILNAILYVVSVVFFYKLAFLVFKNKDHSVNATILLAGNYSILRFGLGAYLMDMGGWAFFIVTLYLAVRFFYSKEEKFAYLAGLTSAAGLFFKESGGVGIFTLFALIFLSDITIANKLKIVIKSGAFLFINIGYHVWIFFIKGYSYFDRYNIVVKYYAPHQTIIRTAKVLGYLFNLGWPLALTGFLRGASKKFTEIEDHKKIFIGLLPSALSFFIYPAYDQRMAFVAVPLLSLLATLALADIKSRNLVYLILGLYIISSFLLLHKLSLPEGVRF